MNKSIGLREQIRDATSNEEVQSLLNIGKTFEWATPRTKLSWKHTANRTLEKLTSATKTAEVNSEEKKDKKKVSKKK
jgi:hypothetical protein